MMFTAAEIVDHENYLETMDKDPKGVVEHVEKNYFEQRMEIIKYMLDIRLGKDQVDGVVMVHKMVQKLTVELTGLVDAHEVVGRSPVMSKDTPTNCGRELYNACARYVSVYNKEQML